MEELNLLYQEVANIILPISNFDWEKVLIRFTKDEKNSGVGIFYKLEGEYVFVNDLVEKGVINESEYDFVLFNLASVVSKLRSVLLSKRQELWKSMIFSMKKNEKYEVNYTYDELDDDMFRDDIVWRYKYLGMLPNDANMKYIEGIEQNLIQ